MALQAAVAGTLAHMAVSLTGTSEYFLAVISAVFVLERNPDATLGAAEMRILGAAIGTLVGIGALTLAGGGIFPWPLAAAMFVMGGLAAWKPKLRYGVIAAAGLAIASEHTFLETAWDRGSAVFLGAAIGLATGFLIWPQSARSRARRQIGTAIGLCRELLEETLSGALGHRDKEVQALHSRFARALAIARDTGQSVRLVRSGARRLLPDLVHCVERLWHALIILDRVGESSDDEGVLVSDGSRDRLGSIRRASSEALACAARFERIPPGDLEELRRACEAAREDGSALPNAALVFGLSEISRNLAEIDEAIGQIHAEE